MDKNEFVLRLEVMYESAYLAGFHDASNYLELSEKHSTASRETMQTIITEFDRLSDLAWKYEELSR